MKEIYEPAKMEVIEFEIRSAITTSGNGDIDDGGSESFD